MSEAMASGEASTVSVLRDGVLRILKVCGGLNGGLRNDFKYSLTQIGVDELDAHEVTAVDRDGVALCMFSVGKYRVRLGAMSPASNGRGKRRYDGRSGLAARSCGIEVGRGSVVRQKVSGKAGRIAVAGCLAGVLAAAHGAEEDLYFSSLPVVATVSRLPQKLSEAPGAVTVIDQAMIRSSGMRNIADLLRLVPVSRSPVRTRKAPWWPTMA